MMSVKQLEDQLEALNVRLLNPEARVTIKQMDKRPSLPTEDGWCDMFQETAEVMHFTLKRKLEMARLGMFNEATYIRITTKWQPENLGLLLIAYYRDRLCAVDPRVSQYDAFFLAEPLGETIEALFLPQKAMKRWRARRESEGRPWTPRPSEQENAEWDEILYDYKRIRKALYPTEAMLKEARDPSKPRMTAAQLHAILDNLDVSRASRQIPSVEDQLKTMDLARMTNVEALSVLHGLQQQARSQPK